MTGAALLSPCSHLLLLPPRSAAPRSSDKLLSIQNPPPFMLFSSRTTTVSRLECSYSTTSSSGSRSEWSSSQDLWEDPDDGYSSEFGDAEEDDDDDDEEEDVENASSTKTAASEFDELVKGSSAHHLFDKIPLTQFWAEILRWYFEDRALYGYFQGYWLEYLLDSSECWISRCLIVCILFRIIVHPWLREGLNMR